MDEKGTWGVSGVIGAIVVLILLFGIFGGGFGGGFGGFGFNRNYPYTPCTSNCEVEKQEIIDSARTQYLIETKNAESTASILASMNAKWNADQAEKIFDLKLNNVMQQNAFNLALMEKNSTIERMTLANSLNDRFTAIDNALSSINCQMLKRPELYGYAVSCPANAVNAYGYNYNCGCGTL